MGFDLFIHMTMTVDPVTGQPYSYGRGSEKVYVLPTLEIPEELRKYLYGRGHHFHVYTEKFNRKDIFEVNVRTFLDRFPSWTRFTESDYYTDDPEGWTHQDHKNFKKLLRLLADSSLGFTVSWSY